jgi:hypothetical protein
MYVPTLIYSRVYRFQYLGEKGGQDPSHIYICIGSFSALQLTPGVRTRPLRELRYLNFYQLQAKYSEKLDYYKLIYLEHP